MVTTLQKLEPAEFFSPDLARMRSGEQNYVAWLAKLVTAAPSSYHAAAVASEVLRNAGFSHYTEEEAWTGIVPGTSGYVVRDGAIIAWRIGAAATAVAPVRVFGCHTDSPGFQLKPQPDFQAAGFWQAGVEVYGGPLLNSWLDRDLEFAGRLILRDGSVKLVRTGAVARIAQLAIHLDREVNSGLQLDRQKHMQPLVSLLGDGSSAESLLAAAAGVSQSDIAGADVCLRDTQEPALLGGTGELLAAGRMDNLSSVAAGLIGILSVTPAPQEIAIFAAFDHEELGSETRSGACGPFLSDVLTRLWGALGAGAEEQVRAMAASWHLSSDAGHGVHPNYQEKHDPNVRPLVGGGPMLKVNANQRYASDGIGAALWQRVCEAAGVEQQVFVSNNSSPCGSTIGALTATRLGIRTVDVGVPLLSMHSVRELAAVSDLHGLYLAAIAFYSGV